MLKPQVAPALPTERAICRFKIRMAA